MGRTPACRRSGDKDCPSGRQLWGKVVCQMGNPYPRFGDMPAFGPFMFIRQEMPGCFNQDEPVVAGFEELLFPLAGGIVEDGSNDEVTFTPLVSTSTEGTSTIEAEDMQMYLRTFDEGQVRDKLRRTLERSYVLAAWIRGKDDGESDAAESKKKEGKAKDPKKDDKAAKSDVKANKDGQAAADNAKKKLPINVIYVADIDLLHNQWIEFRNLPGEDQFRWDNGPFVLNLVDAAAGDERFLEIRQRKPRYSTLQRIEAEAKKAS